MTVYLRHVQLYISKTGRKETYFLFYQDLLFFFLPRSIDKTCHDDVSGVDITGEEGSKYLARFV